MQIIPFSELPAHDFHLSDIIALHQSWNSPNNEFHYRTVPRPNSGLILILSHNVSYTSNDHTILKPAFGDLLYLPSGSFYSVHFADIDSTTLLINFNLYNRQGQEIIFSPDITLLQHHCIDKFRDTFEEICRIYTQTTASKFLLKSMVYSLFHQLLTDGTDDIAQSSIAPAIQYLNSNLHSDIKIQELAHMCAMSESTFRREFHRLLGISPVKYRNAEKLKKARQLLKFSHLSITEISNMLGYYDNAYFCRLFLQATGTTPAQYRLSFMENHHTSDTSFFD